ncbi:MAG: tRNA preQ1(34) S-adenosylmethionine ribosyltransferase-isomerase QueA [Planctomycetia bacterium]|nr:tRNA preQ1(34) S-adenosylmethionine ribosyltransferase-isomerase QueA [Planctomycetia bacterium]
MNDFDYALPEELIAQEPCVKRDDARLLIVDRKSQSLQHRHIFELPEILRPQDLLILNNTKVLPARLLGIRAATGGKWEGLFLQENTEPELNWEFLAHTRGYIKPGEWIELLDRENNPSPYRIQVRGRTTDHHLLTSPVVGHNYPEVLDAIGHVPLPHYIRHGKDNASDLQRYQTVFAQSAGSIAAPTAGLHFTPELLNALKAAGIDQTFVTLHVGAGTFSPVKVPDISKHVMHSEWCEVPISTANIINQCKGRRIAVGTTSMRTLETAALHSNSPPLLQPWSGTTKLFIRPGFRFQVADGLLTNFHLPRSTLLILIAAFAGYELTMKAYVDAVQSHYRFFSYGDAMLIL